MPGTLPDERNTIVTATDRFSDPEMLSTSMTTFATTNSGLDSILVTVESTDVNIDVVYLVVGVGGGTFIFIIMIVVLCVIAGLSIKRIKRLRSITEQSITKSKSSKQTYSCNFKLDILEPPILETRAVSEVVVKFKAENETDEDKLHLASVPSSLCMSTHIDTTVTVRDSAEQLYVCPIMSNVHEPGTTSIL